jgi:hypothetical protein
MTRRVWHVRRRDFLNSLQKRERVELLDTILDTWRSMISRLYCLSGNLKKSQQEEPVIAEIIQFWLTEDATI